MLPRALGIRSTVWPPETLLTPSDLPKPYAMRETGISPAVGVLSDPTPVVPKLVIRKGPSPKICFDTQSAVGFLYVVPMLPVSSASHLMKFASVCAS